MAYDLMAHHAVHLPLSLLVVQWVCSWRPTVGEA